MASKKQTLAMDIKVSAASTESLNAAIEVVDLISDAEEDAEASEASSESDNNSEIESLEEGENESLYEDILEDSRERFKNCKTADSCTEDESIYYRQQIKSLEFSKFLVKHVLSGSITAKKLLSAFEMAPPEIFEGGEDEAYIPLLRMAADRELHKRAKLADINTIGDVVDLLKKCNNIVILTGAGISTSLGIPDFRSKDVGLYAKLGKLGLNDPQEVFSLALFKEDPSIFYSIAKDILPDTNKFSPTHAFIRLLQEKGKLHTNFSQNIDNLEAKAGILAKNLVQCHGSFATATCTKCETQVRGEKIFREIKQGAVPLCGSCNLSQAKSTDKGLKRKRHAGQGGRWKKHRFIVGGESDDEDESDDVPAPGVMKPDITFFGEDLPQLFYDRISEKSLKKVDLVIVIGTSLKVAPVSEIPGRMSANIPQVYISLTPVSHIDFDVNLLGECDVVVGELCRLAGWKLEHHMLPRNHRVSVTQLEGYESVFKIKAIA
ncbi:MAG: NAD-dependent histone deacetylase sir2 [Trizodia sp. TS-e1964]|nr:MAG: NAD-dependent histone deacetylase sir2 [Trizodia sp. TS-e1964]